MAQTSYEDWLARGREHQQAGRLIDAIPCFEQAARLGPEASDPLYYLGEVNWQLGRAQEALRAWQAAAQRAPTHAAPRLAAAEAWLYLGQEAQARETVRSVLDFMSTHRARVIEAVSRASPDEPVDLSQLAALAAKDPTPFAAAWIAKPLAAHWSASAEGKGHALANRLAPHAKALPLALLVPIAREALASGQAPVLGDVVREALTREVDADSLDALRGLALLMQRSGRGEDAWRLAERYASLCALAAPPPYPLTWPLRAAGSRLRVAALWDGGDGDDLREALRQTAASVAWVVWRLGSAPALVERAAEGDARRDIDERAWNGPLDSSLARAIAADDPDVLVDFTGLRQAVGPVAAMQPARQMVTYTAAQGELAELVAALAKLSARVATTPTSVQDAQSLQSQWDEAVRLHQSGETEAARAAYDAFVAVQPRFAPARFLRGVLLRTSGDASGAESDFAEALRLAPDYLDARIAAMRLAAARQAPADMERLAAEGLARSGHRGHTLLRALGEARLACHEPESAMEALRDALARAPTDVLTHYNLGVAAQMRADPREAARAYNRALVLDPDHVPSHFNLGVLFQAQGSLAPAKTAYNNVLARDATRAGAYGNLGEVLLAEGNIEAFLANFARFEAACPDSLSLAVQALEACPLRGDFAALDRYLEGLRAQVFKAADETELVDCLEQLQYLLLFFDVEPGMLRQCALTYDASAPHVYGEPLPRPATRRPGPLRIGYLSGDLRNHVMGKMMWQALEHHDRTRFALYFYSTSPVRDEWTERFAGIARAYVQLESGSEHEAALRIAEDDLDLLVDLSGHTRGAKPGILALKPARVQVTHIAMAGAVGLSTIDFKLTDAYADLPGHADFQLEAPLVMQGCVYPYRHVAPAMQHPFQRGALGIAPDLVLIGAFVSPLKLSRRCLRLWKEVLDALPQARLAISPTHPGFRGVYARIAQAAGIDATRLLVLPQGRNDAENQARYHLIDFVLDPMPFGGVNGVLEPLDMGVPVVTLLGRRHGERTAYSILSNLGVTATVANTGSEYVAIARRLATEAAFAAEVRASISAGLRASPLVDMRAHARNLEAVWIEALARKAPGVLAALGIDAPAVP